MVDTASPWDLVAEAFRYDGMTRDIYILETDISHWQRALAYIARRYDCVRFHGGWNGPDFPLDVATTLFPRDPEAPRTTMTVDISGLHVNCHFFALEEIEFDLDPADVMDADRLEAVIRFMSGLASAAGKDVLLTAENVRDAVILRCRPSSERVEVPFAERRDRGAK